MESDVEIKMDCLLDFEILIKAAECLKTIAHPVRLRMIQILLKGDQPVGELAKACDIPSHMASEHLRILKDRNLLKNQRQGRKIFYGIKEPCLTKILECVETRFGMSDVQQNGNKI